MSATQMWKYHWKQHHNRPWPDKVMAYPLPDNETMRLMVGWYWEVAVPSGSFPAVASAKILYSTNVFIRFGAFQQRVLGALDSGTSLDAAIAAEKELACGRQDGG